MGFYCNPPKILLVCQCRKLHTADNFLWRTAGIAHRVGCGIGQAFRKQSIVINIEGVHLPGSWNTTSGAVVHSLLRTDFESLPSIPYPRQSSHWLFITEPILPKSSVVRSSRSITDRWRRPGASDEPRQGHAQDCPAASLQACCPFTGKTS